LSIAGYQPVKHAVGALGDRGPTEGLVRVAPGYQVTAVHGTGQGDVDQAQEFGAVFELDCFLDPVRFVFGDIVAAIVDDRDSVLVVILGTGAARTAEVRPAIP
jgi:hypothetical protein